MVDIDKFFAKLKESIEAHSVDLKRGELFEPKYLKSKFFSQCFKKVAQTLGEKLELDMREEVKNLMPNPVDLYGYYQRVDYVYSENDKKYIFLELETLDRSQLYLFSDIKLEGGKYTEENKLWYYLGTIKKHLIAKEHIPHYFIWLVILPDKKVADYSANLWDIRKWGDKEEYILHSSLKALIFENPYRFYDHLIKTSARLFLEEKREELRGNCLGDYQNDCELVFLTCTGDRLIMSRGKDKFNQEKEKSVTIEWKSGLTK